VSGDEEILQRVLMRLKARRGGFLPAPGFGSRLHELCGMKPGERSFYAKQFVYEALEAEKSVSVTDVEYSESDGDTGHITAKLRIGENDFALVVNV